MALDNLFVILDWNDFGLITTRWKVIYEHLTSGFPHTVGRFLALNRAVTGNLLLAAMLPNDRR